MKLEDTFSKAFPLLGIARLAGGNTSTNSCVSPVSKAKKFWRQKTIQSKENLLAAPNLLSRFDGKYLDLNNFGIPAFPLNILPQITSVQVKRASYSYFNEIGYLSCEKGSNTNYTGMPRLQSEGSEHITIFHHAPTESAKFPPAARRVNLHTFELEQFFFP